MDWRRTLGPVALVAALAAGIAGANMAMASAASDAAIGMPAGWEISDYDPASSWLTLTISHAIGEDKLEFSIDVTAHGAGPARPIYRVQSQFDGQSCLYEDAADVGNPAPAERIRLTHAFLERALGSLNQDCFAPGRQAALMQGFDAAFAAQLARYERERPRMDAAGDAMTAEQADMANMMQGMEMNMSMDEPANAASAPK